MPALTLPIVHARQETPRHRVVQLGLEGRTFPFLAGQHVLLGQRGADPPRPYSLACSPAWSLRHGLLEFLVQVGGDGSAGPHLPQLDPGTGIEVDGPAGGFVLPAGPFEGGFLFVAGGTGIAPIRSMIGELVEAGAGLRVGLVRSGRTPADLPFAGEFRALADAGQIRLLETVTREAPASWQGISGRIGLEELASAMPGPNPLCFVCGPDSLVEDAPRLLGQLGVPAGRIVTEHWADRPVAETGAA